MNLLKPDSIDEYIISSLQKKPRSGAELLAEIRVHRPKTTKQALYAALRKLKSAEIVVMHAMRISLSSIWVDNMQEFFEKAKLAYEGKGTESDSFLNLADGERISYSFKDPAATDIFWGHAFNVLMATLPPNQPVCLYNPHEWFILAREESEKTLIEQANNEGHPWHVYIAGKTPLDEYTKSLFPRPSVAYTADNGPFKENFYLNLFGDFIIEVLLDQNTQKSIDYFYLKHSIWDTEASKELHAIVSNMKGKNKLSISRNARKAAKYRSFFKKYFI